jgi:ornithine carbamoyltransferase
MAVPFARPAPRFLSVADLDAGAIESLLDLADALKAGQVPAGTPPLAGRAVALIFQKPSLRTRVSFEVGITRLGGTPVLLSGDEVGLGTREAPADVARTLERYVDLIVARVFDHGLLRELADAAAIPVINALSDVEHPCQALADVMTLRERWGDVRGRQLVFVGDGNNVAASLLLAGAICALNVRVVTPEGYQPTEGVVERARALGEASGARIEVSTDPIAGVRGADAVYTDVWASMGQEEQAERRRHVFRPYAITHELLEQAPDALVMHCLPAHRGEEIASDVIDGPDFLAFEQSENRLWVQMALLIRLSRARNPGAALPEPLQLPLASGFRTSGRPARG